MPDLNVDPRFQVFRDRLERQLQEWNPKLVKALEKKGTFQNFLDVRVENAVSQLLHAEANNQWIDQDEVEQEMYPEAEKMPQEELEEADYQDGIQYGPELPDIYAEEFSLLFDYSEDGSRYVVSHGKDVIISGPAAHDPDDYITDLPLGDQFFDIATALKKRYGAKLVDLVPTERAKEELTDLWGWHVRLDQGRGLVRCR